MPDIDIAEFLAQHQLPSIYSDLAEKWFYPIVQHLIRHRTGAEKPLIVGVNGAQGSGKSTLSALFVFILTRHYRLKAVSLSLDDFYLTRQQRHNLSIKVHPLMATRGVPGTHDIPLALHTINQLLTHDSTTRIPRFNKASDERHDEKLWDSISEPVDIIVLEGWCLGAEPQSMMSLIPPVNDLEKLEDPQGHWRHYVNTQLSTDYPELFELIDTWIMLKAPSFECVYNWRLEQENKLISSTQNLQETMNPMEINRFIKFYQRITEHLLITLPDKVDFLFELDEKRQIINSSIRSTQQ